MYARDMYGRFAKPQHAVPTKAFRGFLQELSEKYGNTGVRDLLKFYNRIGDTKREDEPSEVVRVVDSSDPLNMLFKAEGMPLSDYYCILKFNNTGLIKRFADLAKQQVNQGVWEEPDDYHVTMLYTYDTDPYTISSMADVLDDAVYEQESFPVIELDGYGTFENGESNVLFLKARKTPELMRMQARLYDVAKAHLANCSEHSEPDSYTPHLTLAYSDKPFDKSKLPDIGGAVIVPSRLVANIEADDGGYMTINSVEYPFHTETDSYPISSYT